MNDLPVTEPQLQDYVYGLAASAQDKAIFAARASGLYCSTDEGLTWQNCYSSLNLAEPLLTTAVAVSPDFERDQTLFAGAPGGVLRSTDGGCTWQITMLPAPPPTPSALVISPDFAQDSIILAGTMEDGMFRSTDGGSSWQAWNFGLLDLNVLSLAISPAFAQDETLFAGTESGLFRSANGGRAWREVTLPAGFEPVLSLALSSDYAQDGSLFVGTESQGLFYSSDQGASWIPLGQSQIHLSVNSILLTPDYATLLVMLANTLLVSQDKGQSWAELSPAPGQSLTAMAASHRISEKASVWVGLSNGQVVRVDL